MVARAAILLVAVVAVPLAWANVYTVTNTKNAGVGSLRWAIKQANGRPGQDTIVFQPSLTGKGILITTALPRLNDDETKINGDINGDGAPDIALNGKNAEYGASGLVVNGDECVISGLAITNFPKHGILLENTFRSKVRSCHVGVNLAGIREKYNLDHQIVLQGAQECRIGGATPAGRNVISAGYEEQPYPQIWGVHVRESAGNTIAGNYIGLNRNGTDTLWQGLRQGAIKLEGPPQATSAGQADGARVLAVTHNTIGGTTPAERNVIAGVKYGLELVFAVENTISGNTFGLAANGNSALSMVPVCVAVRVGSVRNTIGGTDNGAGNVFAGGGTAVMVSGPGTTDNRVRGNYFGTNVAGNKQRPLATGVYIGSLPEAQIIGGSTAKAGNYFALKSPSKMCAVWLDKAGGGTLVRRNKFGVLPNGTDALSYNMALYVDGVAIQVTDNQIVNASMGLRCTETPPPMRALRNLFRRCGTAVEIGPNSRCTLGDLGNARTTDDGGNLFRKSNTWHVRNYSPWLVKCEGNGFGTTVRSEINQKIHDKRDDDTRGRVDFSPLIGGVLPTGDTGILAVMGTATTPTPSGGVEITFGLSAAAQVQARILNIAGRPVKTLCRAAACEAGTNTLLWNAQSDSGLAVPNGTYLVEVIASTEDGTQARAMTQARVAR